MSSDFWAGYVSGAAGILIGNPLDVVKVRLQAGSAPPKGPSLAAATTLAGSAAPVLGYGALNALLFVSYNRSEAALNNVFSTRNSLWAAWMAGAVGGLATWVVSTPTELVKCRAQMSVSSSSSWLNARSIWKAQGVRGFYTGGVVTALRDSIGYGFYFWSYELATTHWPAGKDCESLSATQEMSKVLTCGGLAGIATWASIFPLDTIKTRMQTQHIGPALSPALAAVPKRRVADLPRHRTSLDVARLMFQEGGTAIFFRGLTVCCIRAFVVNAVQWAVYEWTLRQFGESRKLQASSANKERLAIE